LNPPTPGGHKRLELQGIGFRSLGVGILSMSGAEWDESLPAQLSKSDATTRTAKANLRNSQPTLGAYDRRLCGRMTKASCDDCLRSLAGPA